MLEMLQIGVNYEISVGVVVLLLGLGWMVRMRSLFDYVQMMRVSLFWERSYDRQCYCEQKLEPKNMSYKRRFLFTDQTTNLPVTSNLNTNSPFTEIYSILPNNEPSFVNIVSPTSNLTLGKATCPSHRLINNKNTSKITLFYIPYTKLADIIFYSIVFVSILFPH